MINFHSIARVKTSINEYKLKTIKILVNIAHNRIRLPTRGEECVVQYIGTKNESFSVRMSSRNAEGTLHVFHRLHNSI